MSANSVPAREYLPNAFALTLGQRSAGTGPLYQNSFFQANETARRHEKTRLAPHADEGSLAALTLDWSSRYSETDRQNVVLVQSPTGNDQQFILVTVKKRDVLRLLPLPAARADLAERSSRLLMKS